MSRRLEAMISQITDSELFKVICELREIKDMRVTTDKSCFKSALGIGAAAGVGGLLLGPRGLLLGSLLGGAIATAATDGQFRSVPDILMNDLTAAQKRKLGNALRNLLSAKNIISVLILLNELQTDSGLRKNITLIVRNFLRTEMKYNV